MQVQDSKFHVQLVNKVPKFDKLLLPQASSPSLKIQSWRIGSWKNWIQFWIGKDDDEDDDDDCVGGIERRWALGGGPS